MGDRVWGRGMARVCAGLEGDKGKTKRGSGGMGRALAWEGGGQIRECVVLACGFEAYRALLTQRLRPTLKSNPEFTAGLIQTGRKLKFDSAVCVSLLPSSFLPSVRRDVGLSCEQSAGANAFFIACTPRPRSALLTCGAGRPESHAQGRACGMAFRGTSQPRRARRSRARPLSSSAW